MFKETVIGYQTLEELIRARFADFSIEYGRFPLCADVSHGVCIEVNDNSKHGYGVSVRLFPYVKWTDGGWKPCYFGGSEFYIDLFRR